jgi:hypothetical protein
LETREKVASLAELLRSRGWRVYEQLVEKEVAKAVDSLFEASDYPVLDNETIVRRFLTVHEFVRASRNVAGIPRAFMDENEEEE